MDKKIEGELKREVAALRRRAAGREESQSRFGTREEGGGRPDHVEVQGIRVQRYYH